VARQMHQKTMQHYRVNIVKQQVTWGQCSVMMMSAFRECPTLRDMLIQPIETALNQTTFLIQAQALLGKVIG